MTCTLPSSWDAIEGVIVACSGVSDWRPAFLLGAGAAFVVGLVVVPLVLALWRAR